MADLEGDAILPEEMLRGVHWPFAGSPFSDKAAFERNVRQYQIDITGKDSWQPNRVVILWPRIRVIYMCWQGDEQLEPVVELVSDNGESFTAGELLVKLHNAVVEQLRDMDRHFFEGLYLHSTQTPEKPPLYVLSQGS